MNIRDANLERPIRARRTAARVKPINLALQGGGAHGAFAWGVLDRLLEDGRLSFEGVSATSAGAMNAAVLAHGLLHGGPDGARAALAEFWKAIADSAALYSPFRQLPWMKAFFNFTLLRQVLEAHVDFAALRRASPIPRAPTRMRTARIRGLGMRRSAAPT